MLYIYGLHDPLVDSIFYVGKSRQPRSRLSAHISEALDIEKSVRIANILKAGLAPGLQILQEIPDSLVYAPQGDFVRSQEGKWIAHFGNQVVNRARWTMPHAFKEFTRI